MSRKDFTSLVQPENGAGSALFNPTFTAISTFTGIQFPNDSRTVVEIINGATASNYTVNVGAAVPGHTTVPDGPTACPVSNTAPQRIGPWPAYYNQPGTNLVTVDFSTTTTVTVAVTQRPGV